MESELEYKFFKSCAPQFFSKELKNLLSSKTPDETILRTSFLGAIDTLVSLLNTHHIPLSSILPETFQDILVTLSTNTPLVIYKQFLKKSQFILQFELLRADPSSITLNSLAKLGRSLCMQMALEEDSSAFNRFYISDILPRYSPHISRDLLLEISKEFELFEETQEFLDEVCPKPLPKKRKAPKTSMNGSVKVSPVRRSPRLIKTQVALKEKKVNLARSLSGNTIKKQVSIKGLRSLLPVSPEPAQNQLSVQAKKLQEYNQKYFYDKKEGNSEKDPDEPGKEGKILVLSTPTKPENNIVYEVKTYKNIFNV
ncbi:hypothetical protein SteCoe_11645 [Stentor coeruleus]|uniref:Uncharacterized protein n=1 Tax=Stentor coeruleus TaxID=5963 RepID=A0A1R2CCU9_9CILI|nr:hypothetical protein SteCoe_11645 [Stentor coeruleus]